jgi:hypothetical protein
MKAYIFYFLLFFSLCTYAQDTIKTKVIVHDIVGYGENEDFAREAIKKLENVINSKEFDSIFLKEPMTQLNNKTKEEILALIKLARENYGDSNIDNVMDLRLRVVNKKQDGRKWVRRCRLNSWAKTIGIEASKTGYTRTCKERLKLWKANKNYGCYAGHYMHEFMHNLGFSHTKKPKKSSVVYKTGIIVRNLINKNTSPCPTKYPRQ